MNGIIIKPFKHTYCALIRGHKWKNISPVMLHWVCQECIYCGKTRVVQSKISQGLFKVVEWHSKKTRKALERKDS